MIVNTMCLESNIVFIWKTSILHIFSQPQFLQKSSEINFNSFNLTEFSWQICKKSRKFVYIETQFRNEIQIEIREFRDKIRETLFTFLR